MITLGFPGKYKLILNKVFIFAIVCGVVAIIRTNYVLIVGFFGLAVWAKFFQLFLSSSVTLDEQGIKTGEDHYDWSSVEYIGSWGPILRGKVKGVIVHINNGKRVELNSLMDNFEEALKVASIYASFERKQGMNSFYYPGFIKAISIFLITLDPILVIILGYVFFTITQGFGVIFAIIPGFIIFGIFGNLSFTIYRRLLVTDQIIASIPENPDSFSDKGTIKLQPQDIHVAFLGSLKQRTAAQSISLVGIDSKHYYFGSWSKYYNFAIWNVIEDYSICIERIDKGMAELKSASAPENPENIVNEILTDEKAKQITILIDSAPPKLEEPLSGSTQQEDSYVKTNDIILVPSLRKSAQWWFFTLCLSIIFCIFFVYLWRNQTLLPWDLGNFTFVSLFLTWIIPVVFFQTIIFVLFRIGARKGIGESCRISQEGIFDLRNNNQLLNWKDVATWAVSSFKTSLSPFKKEVVFLGKNREVLLKLKDINSKFEDVLLYIRGKLGTHNDEDSKLLSKIHSKPGKIYRNLKEIVFWIFVYIFASHAVLSYSSIENGTKTKATVTPLLPPIFYVSANSSTGALDQGDIPESLKSMFRWKLIGIPNDSRVMRYSNGWVILIGNERVLCYIRKEGEILNVYSKRPPLWIVKYTAQDREWRTLGFWAVSEEIDEGNLTIKYNPEDPRWQRIEGKSIYNLWRGLELLPGLAPQWAKHEREINHYIKLYAPYFLYFMLGINLISFIWHVLTYFWFQEKIKARNVSTSLPIQ